MDKIYIHIGHHKTATTFLQEVFKRNDSINIMNDTVAPWDDELIRSLVLEKHFSKEKVVQVSSKRYLKNKVNIISAERLSGHPYSCGYDSTEILERIKSCFPNAKVLITKRNPESFKTSVYKQMVKEGYPGKFENFIDDRQWKALQYRNKYFEQTPLINSYKSQFTEVKILEFENLIDDQDEFLNDLMQFIGVKLNHINISKKRVNPTWKTRRIKALRTINYFRKTELNKFPIINIGDKAARQLSIIFQIFYSNKSI